MVLGNHWKTQPGYMRADRAGIGFPIGQTVDEVKCLIKYAKLKPKGTITIEIGTRNGGSALIFAMHTFDPVVTIDILDDPRAFLFKDKKSGKTVQLYKEIPPLPMHWARYPGGKRIEKVCCISHEVDWSLEPRPVGLLFIDGDHEYDGVKKDWEHFWPHVVPGGYCMLHDFESRGFPAISEFYYNELEPNGIRYIDRGGTVIVFQKEDNSHVEENQG